MDAALAPAGAVVASAKLHVPEGDGAPPLRLQAARLALVAAPTAAVAAWAAAVARPVAWVALDPEDADPVRLWRCVIGALRVLAPGFGADAEAILAVGPAALDDAVVPLVAAEAAPWDEPPVLVLDRVQALGARCRAIVPSLARWLDRAPDGSSLVLAGDPAALADLGASLHAAAADPCVTPVTGTVPATEGLLR